MEKLKKLIFGLPDILYPRRCAMCDAPLKRIEPYVCEKCAEKVRFISEKTCIKCGRKMGDGAGRMCHECINADHSFDAAFAPFVYEGDIRESIARFKYRGRAEYAAFYARCMYVYGRKLIEDWHADALVPVPIHRTRLAKRGYNQAYLIAKELARITEIPVMDDLIDRVKKTEAQKELNAAQRKNNLRAAFAYKTERIAPETVIIVDDIFTTGSTVNAVSRILKEHGAKRVYAACVSAAILPN